MSSHALLNEMDGNCCELTEAIIFTDAPVSVVRLSIPIHGNRPLKTGLLVHILKVAGLTEAD